MSTDTRSEAERQNAILLKYGREPDVTLWRQNTGQAKTPICERSHLERILGWLTETARKPGTGAAETYLRQSGDLIRALLKEPQRYTRYGLTKGSSDIIGIVQSCDMMWESSPRGYHLGVFLALEVKTETGRVSPEQQMFLDLVNRRGGIGRVVRNEDDAGRAIEEARRL